MTSLRDDHGVLRAREAEAQTFASSTLGVSWDHMVSPVATEAGVRIPSRRNGGVESPRALV